MNDGINIICIPDMDDQATSSNSSKDSIFKSTNFLNDPLGFSQDDEYDSNWLSGFRFSLKEVMYWKRCDPCSVIIIKVFILVCEIISNFNVNKKWIK